MKYLEIQLARLIKELTHALDESPSNEDDVLTSLKSMPTHSDFEELNLLRERVPPESIENVHSMSKLFHILSHVAIDPPLWDIRNYHLLKVIADVHLDIGNYSFVTKGVMDEYIKRLEEFENATLLCLYIHVRRNYHFKPCKHSELIAIMLDRPCKNYSISASEKIRKNLFNGELGIPEHAVFNDGERMGSVQQQWIVPKAIIPLLKKKISNMRFLCKKYGITAIRINDVNILEHAENKGKLTGLVHSG